MSAEVVAVMLLAAFLHATWNAVVKGGENKLFEITLVTVGAGAGALCAMPFVPLPAPESLGFLALSCCIHFLYHLSIPAAYARMDLSCGYTIMRGVAPLFTTLVLFFAGTSVGSGGLIGIACLCGGVLTLGWDGLQNGRMPLQGTLIALGTAVIICGYTLSDGYGARLSGHALSYTCWIFLVNVFPITLYVLFRHGRAFIAYAKVRALPGLCGGLCSMGSYGIALWAMTRAPISLVAALRESSVVFGMLLGVFFLKEPFTPARAVAVVMMMVGTVAIRLA